MALVQQTVGNTAYYTDGVNYYTFHVVSSPSDALWIFACMDLGITKRSAFSTDEAARINDLAGTGTQQKTKYLLLKNGNAVPVPYHITGAADLHVNDVILRRVSAPAGADMVVCPHCASRVKRGPVCSACGKPLSP
jgi:hypothetical protein